MTDTATYTKPVGAPSSNEWLMTGIVLASPSTGQIKAVMPVFNSYSDIRVDHIFPIDSDTLLPDSSLPVYDQSSDIRSSEVAQDAQPQAKLCPQERNSQARKAKWSAIMKIGTSLDGQHLSVMVGLASLAGAFTNIVFSFFSEGPAPQAVVIGVTAGGFIAGRFLSEKIRARHDG